MHNLHTKQMLMRSPSIADGAILYRLAKEAGGLDVNSEYAYLLHGLHHADCCIMAEKNGKAAGFISGYWIPQAADGNVTPLGERLFIWQMAVHPDYRGQGLAFTMLRALLKRPANQQVRFLETTITPSNTASVRSFEKLAEQLGTQMVASQEFSTSLFSSSHEAETLYKIGPFNPNSLN